MGRPGSGSSGVETRETVRSALYNTQTATESKCKALNEMLILGYLYALPRNMNRYRGRISPLHTFSKYLT